MGYNDGGGGQHERCSPEWRKRGREEGKDGMGGTGSPESDTAKQPACDPKGISPTPTGEQQTRSGPEGLSAGGHGRFENRQLKK